MSSMHIQCSMRLPALFLARPDFTAVAAGFIPRTIVLTDPGELEALVYRR